MALEEWIMRTDAPSVELMRLANGFQVSQAIHVAATLGIADHLKDGAKSSEQLALLTGAHPDALYRLLRALASVAVLFEDAERSFSLTPMGECLCSDSKTPIGPWARYIGRPHYWQAWGHLLHSVRTGENAFTSLNGGSIWQFRDKNPAEASIFNQAMSGNSRVTLQALLDTYDFSGFGHIVDVGGGEGQTIAGILRAHPALQGTLFDQPPVAARAREFLSGQGLAERCRVIGGNFFETVPGGGDAYVLRMVIHDWEDEEAITILKSCRAAMSAHARLLLIEQVIPPPNEGPVMKFSDLNMLVAPGGRERTTEEFERLYALAGFTLARVVKTGPRMCVVEGEPA
jgi:hypothetical protein